VTTDPTPHIFWLSGVSLLGEKYLHPSLADLAVPFASGYSDRRRARARALHRPSPPRNE
jgi:hypothetical protein